MCDNGMVPAAYQYQPLRFENAIRLVHIHPARSRRAPILCDISHANTEARYEALSYAWGDPELSRRVILKEHSCTIRITESLHNALLHLRQADRVRVIWADGICIHQADNSERNHQVQLMARIYQCARRVIVWLGGNDPVTDYGFSVLQCIAECQNRSFTVGVIVRGVLKPMIEESSKAHWYQIA